MSLAFRAAVQDPNAAAAAPAAASAPMIPIAKSMWMTVPKAENDRAYPLTFDIAISAGC